MADEADDADAAAKDPGRLRETLTGIVTEEFAGMSPTFIDGAENEYSGSVGSANEASSAAIRPWLVRVTLIWPDWPGRIEGTSSAETVSTGAGTLVWNVVWSW